MYKPPIVVAVAIVFSSLIVRNAVADIPIPAEGSECLNVVVTSNEPVILTFQGHGAVYQNAIYLMTDGADHPCDDGDLTNDRYILLNHDTPVGANGSLGTFPIGTVLTFRDCVKQGCQWIVYTGCAERNPDGKCHARVQAEWQPNETLVGFEDLIDGPFSYSDCNFSLTNTTAGPPSCAMGCAVAVESKTWGHVKSLYR